MALALPIASQLDAPLSIAAAGVLCGCLLAANFGPQILTALGYKVCSRTPKLVPSLVSDHPKKHHSLYFGICRGPSQPTTDKSQLI